MCFLFVSFSNLLVFLFLLFTDGPTPSLFLQFFARLANVARNRVQLVEEVEDFQQKRKTQFDDLYEAKEGQRIVDSKLADIERFIKKDQADFQVKRDTWATERAGLFASNEKVIVAKLAAGIRMSKAENRVVELLARLTEVEKLARTKAKWFYS